MKGQRAEELHLLQLLPRRNNPADARPLLCPACPRGDASSSRASRRGCERRAHLQNPACALRGRAAAPCQLSICNTSLRSTGGLLARRCQHLAAGSIFEPTSLPPSIALARARRGRTHFGAGAILSAFSWDAGAKPEAAAVPGARRMEAELGRGGWKFGGPGLHG